MLTFLFVAPPTGNFGSIFQLVCSFLHFPTCKFFYSKVVCSFSLLCQLITLCIFSDHGIEYNFFSNRPSLVDMGRWYECSFSFYEKSFFFFTFHFVILSVKHAKSILFFFPPSLCSNLSLARF